MFKDFIDLSVLKDAQPGFFSQSVVKGEMDKDLAQYPSLECPSLQVM